MKKFIITFFIMCLFSIALFGQNQDEASLKPETVIERANCESNLAQITILVQSLPMDTLIIIISHLGDEESHEVGPRRLHNAKAWYTELSSKNIRQKKYVVTAEGTSVKGKGYLDFFVKGELKLRAFFNKNDDLYLGPCTFMPEEKPCSTQYENLFYPCYQRKI